jgi:hypothetical protein
VNACPSLSLSLSRTTHPLIPPSQIEDSEKNAKGKHTRALYLFSDRLVVTKPRGNKFVFRQVRPMGSTGVDNECWRV